MHGDPGLGVEVEHSFNEFGVVLSVIFITRFVGLLFGHLLHVALKSEAPIFAGPLGIVDVKAIASFLVKARHRSHCAGQLPYV